MITQISIFVPFVRANFKEVFILIMIVHECITCGINGTIFDLVDESLALNFEIKVFRYARFYIKGF